jgi:hypothetical protein
MEPLHKLCISVKGFLLIEIVSGCKWLRSRRMISCGGRRRRNGRVCRNVTRFRTESRTSAVSARVMCSFIDHYTPRTKLVGENSVVFHNDGPVHKLREHCHAYHLKTESTIGHSISCCHGLVTSLGHESMMNLSN